MQLFYHNEFQLDTKFRQWNNLKIYIRWAYCGCGMSLAWHTGIKNDEKTPAPTPRT